MYLNIIIIFFEVMLHMFISAETCENRNTLFDVKSLDITQLHISEYLPHFSCNRTGNEVTFYKCKVVCMRQETCVGFRYVSYCEHCIFASERLTVDLNLDFLYVKQDADIVSQNLGKALYFVITFNYFFKSI